SVKTACLSVLAGMIIAAGPGAATADSLAGNAGDVRYPAQVAGTEGPCKDAYKDYIAAAGHSAYAQTPLNHFTYNFFCGRAFNAPSQKVAEELAIANCNSVGKKYKIKIAGRCEIYASK